MGYDRMFKLLGMQSFQGWENFLGKGNPLGIPSGFSSMFDDETDEDGCPYMLLLNMPLFQVPQSILAGKIETKTSTTVEDGKIICQMDRTVPIKKSSCITSETSIIETIRILNCHIFEDVVVSNSGGQTQPLCTKSAEVE